MGPRCSSAETQVCHRSYIISANVMVTPYIDGHKNWLWSQNIGAIPKLADIV